MQHKIQQHNAKQKTFLNH